MTCPVYYEDAPVASLTCIPQGLFLKLTLTCKAPPQRYLFSQTENEPPVFYGTLVPTEDGWHFCKTVSKAQLPQIEKTRFFLSSKEQPLFICGKAVPNGRIVSENGSVFLQIPFDETKPFPLVSAARYFSIVEKDGKTLWQCRLDAENTPVLVDKEGNCDTINAVS